MTPTPPPSTGPRTLTWRKKLLFAALTTALFFLLLEGVLFLAGVRTLLATDDPFVGFSGYAPLFVRDTDSDGVWMATARNKLPWFNAQSFPLAKKHNAVRIFSLGGSTTYGHPYDDATSFSGWLRELLPRAAPNQTYEVINAGGVSYASYRIVALMEELCQYQPDLFIIYTGHNEFLEERTYRDLRAESPAWRGVRATLCQSRTYSTMHRLLKSAPDASAPRFQLPAEVDEVLSHTVGPTSYQRDDDLRRKILQHFELNLDRMVALARAHGADVVFVTPACNLKDSAPFKSQHGARLASLEEWTAHYEKGKALAKEGKHPEALAAFDAASRLDDRFAELHYQRGKLLLRMGRLAEAAAAFKRAREEDVCPLRALDEIVATVRRVAGRLATPLVDFESRINNDCLRKHGHNVPGREYFLSHVHPRIEFNRLLAVDLVEQLAAHKRIDGQAKLDQEHIDQATTTLMSRIDPVAHAVALRNLAKLLNWAGKHLEAGPLALESLQTIPDDPESLFLAAAYLQHTGELDQAIAYYRRALKRYPNAAEAHHRLGVALAEQDKLAQALPHFAEVIRLEPKDEDAHYNLGRLLLEMGKADEAIPHLQNALRLRPDHQAARDSLRRAEGRSG